MTVFFTVFLILLMGEAYGRHHGQRNCKDHGRNRQEFYHKGTPDFINYGFYIDIGVYGSKDPPVCIFTNGSYEMNVGEALKLTCRRNYGGALRWTDDSGAGTGPRDNRELSLVITPDVDDINRTFACRTHFNDSIEHIRVVRLVVKDANHIKSGPGNVIFIKIGEPWITTQCHSAVIYNKTTDDPNIRSPQRLSHTLGKNITVYLNETFDEVILYCVKYERVLNPHTKTTYVERVKSKFTLCLDRGQEENERRKKELEDSEVKKKDSQSNAAAIVGGVLGAVIFVLLALLVGIGYKTMRRRAPDDSTTEVVYAEIEERLTAPPPPPQRNPIPYAQIIGSLVPKQSAQTDNPTIQSQDKDDPYSTITSVANDRGTQVSNER